MPLPARISARHEIGSLQSQTKARDGTDKLDFTAFNVDTRAELLAIATITAAGTSTLINLTAGGSVTIRNLTPGAIGDSDFVGMPVGG